YTFSFGQLVAIYLIIVFTSEFFDCHEFCEKFEHLNDGKVIFQSDTYKYSYYYHYSQLIRRNQASPIVSENFEKLEIKKQINLEFPITFYGDDIDTVSVGTDETKILNGKGYFAVRRSCRTNIDNKNDTIKVMHLIDSNGKIYFYYENIPKGLKKVPVQSDVFYYIQCGKASRGAEIRVPVEWIQSGTLVEYEILGEHHYG
ncbi:unnamed protein product, partial [Schistosoma intercalatum]